MLAVLLSALRTAHAVAWAMWAVLRACALYALDPTDRGLRAECVARAVRYMMASMPLPVLRRAVDANNALASLGARVARVERRGFRGSWTTAALPPDAESLRGCRVLLYLHGGGYSFGSDLSYFRELRRVARRAGRVHVLSVDYPLAPEHRFPAQLLAARSAYRHLVRDLRVPPQSVVVGGDSAGGNLSLALCGALLHPHLLRELDEARALVERDGGAGEDWETMPQPGGLLLISPWVDPSAGAPSVVGNARWDMLVPGRPGARGVADEPNCMASFRRRFLGRDERRAAHPLVAPLRLPGFAGLPPTLVVLGGRETLRDEGAALVEALRVGGVPVAQLSDAAMFHIYPLLPLGSGAAGLRDLDRVARFVAAPAAFVAATAAGADAPPE